MKKECRILELLGTWSLISCINYRDDEVTYAYGDPPAGQIQYTADGRMSAFLMDPAWAERGNSEADGFTEFFAYAGTWQRDGANVTHHVLFSSSPKRVGTSFVRRINEIDKVTMELVTLPEISKSGRTYVTRLRWARCEPSSG
jgi:hypothetical protein